MERRRLVNIVVIVVLIMACKTSDDLPSTNPQNSTPEVMANSTYDVVLEEDVVYAEGLSHNSLNSSDYTIMPLMLDVYTPNNTLENRPAFMFIHGGAFIGGSKQQEEVLHLADYYTSRGWVFISVDYRLQRDKGTVPQEWADYSTNVPSGDSSQFLAIYPAQRDAKAAMRWLVANAEKYHINTDYITVGGGSAGAVTAIALGISNQEDFRDEISRDLDPTLAGTNLDQTYKIQTIINFWGSKVALDILELLYDYQRFDSNDPPLFIAHGTEDPTVPFSNAEDLKTIYDNTKIPLAYYPFEGYGHGTWNATVDNKRIEELAFEFIVEQQGLVIK